MSVLKRMIGIKNFWRIKIANNVLNIKNMRLSKRKIGMKNFWRIKQ